MKKKGGGVSHEARSWIFVHRTNKDNRSKNHVVPSIAVWIFHYGSACIASSVVSSFHFGCNDAISLVRASISSWSGVGLSWYPRRAPIRRQRSSDSWSICACVFVLCACCSLFAQCSVQVSFLSRFVASFCGCKTHVAFWCKSFCKHSLYVRPMWHSDVRPSVGILCM